MTPKPMMLESRTRIPIHD
jgi:hypothetical protein